MLQLTGPNTSVVLVSDHGFHEPNFSFHRYQVERALDPSSHWCDTVVWVDSGTGEFADFYAPTGMESGSTFTIWLYYFHFGWVGGIAYRIVLCISGVVTAILSVTGFLIWWRKRGKRSSPSTAHAATPALRSDE